MTIEELLKAAEQALKNSEEMNTNPAYALPSSLTGTERDIAAGALSLGLMYYAEMSKAYSQLAQAKMQYEAHVPWQERQL